METSELPTGCPGSRFAFPGAAAGRELGGCSTWVPSQKTAAAAGPSPPSVLNRAREPASAAGATSVSSTSSTRKGPTARHDRRRGAGNCCLFSRSQLRSKLLAPCSARILALVRPAVRGREAVLPMLPAQAPLATSLSGARVQLERPSRWSPIHIDHHPPSKHLLAWALASACIVPAAWF